MATSDFLPFATGAGATVLSQTDYAALPAVSTGYGSGIAKAEQLNKTWRQSSIMASVLAQFIANQTGQNSVDDGTTAALLANLLSAVKTAATSNFSAALAANSYITIPTPAGTVFIQWGTSGTLASQSVVGVTFPIAFPTACRVALASPNDGGLIASYRTSITTKSKTGMAIGCTYTTAPTFGADWIAAGN